MLTKTTDFYLLGELYPDKQFGAQECLCLACGAEYLVGHHEDGESPSCPICGDEKEQLQE